jgi:type IV pilus assembly protein PilM
VFSKNRILTLDVGASKLVLGEFIAKKGAPLTLTKYVVRTLDGVSVDSIAPTMTSLAGFVREMMAEGGIKAAPLYVTLSGPAVFPRFVKLPPVSPDKIDELVVYEASENLPFPIDEIVWDYQLVTEEGSHEVDALIVATKRETALDAAACAEAAGLPITVVDAIPFALYNCVRFNYVSSDASTMVLDIGARSTNLVFVEGSKIFTRSIPVAGNTITSEIARSLSVSVDEAERIKKDVGFVALGGTYAVMDDEVSDKVSKVIRNVVTRLHTEVTRSINFYRSQQGGSAPSRLLLAGGSSLTRHIDTFFREKLGCEVEYLNPFVNVAVAESARHDTEGLFLMAPSVGLALRSHMKCPVEINLTPPAILAAQRFSRRLPCFGVAVAGLVLTLLCWFTYAKNLQAVYEGQNDVVKERLSAIECQQNQIDAIKRESSVLSEKADFLSTMAASRASFLEILGGVHKAMIKDAWLTSLSFEEGEDGSSWHMNLVVSGFKREIDSLVSGRSAAEVLLANLVSSGGLFVGEGSRVIRELSKEDDKISELHLRVKLAVVPGTSDEAWSARWAAK